MAPSTVLDAGNAAGCSSHRISKYLVYIVAMLLLGVPNAHSQENNNNKFYTDETNFKLLVGETHMFSLIQVGEYDTTLKISSNIQHPDILQLIPDKIKIPGSISPDPKKLISHNLSAYGKSPGNSDVSFNVTPTGIVELNNVFVKVTVMISKEIYYISVIVGWIYFLAWSVSFYPQIYTNYARGSVVGLNFDFVVLNIMGFTMYSLFNCGLYFSSDIQAEYFSRHPRSLNPVQLNDVFFSLHAAFATIVTIVQCIIYEREDQTVSLMGRSLLVVMGTVAASAAGLAAFDVIAWLDFLYVCSYIKLAITLIKYVPQAIMNYQRQSTEGWSIGNIFLDFTGGSLSILQMVLNAYNYNDWISFFGDVTKFGLGLFSLIFDIFFMLQHYVFYRADKKRVVSESSEDEEATMLTKKHYDGREYILVDNDWHSRYIRLPGVVEENHDERVDDPENLDTSYQAPP